MGSDWPLMAIWRESTLGVVTEAGLRLVLSQVSESGPPAPSFGEAKAVEEPAFDHAKWQLQAKGYAGTLEEEQ
jgi:hypothetical protein